MSENVECQTCGGRGRIDLPDYRNARCVDCNGTGRTPENVECPKCRGRYWTCPLRHYPHRDGCPHCPDCPTPENVETPT